VIEASRQRHALAAINAVLILARQLAYEGKCVDVADVLDVAELLPLLMLDAEDRTAVFRAHLYELSKRRSDFTLALERFDAST
jgi:CII-binding regulator of phage lambda lysogenization HflD